jgi:hypothetical protein
VIIGQEGRILPFVDADAPFVGFHACFGRQTIDWRNFRNR